MRIIFLGDIVGRSGCNSIKKNLPNIIEKNKVDFVVVNGENAADQGIGITENITNELLSAGVDVITTGNTNQKETTEHIKLEKDFWDHTIAKRLTWFRIWYFNQGISCSFKFNGKRIYEK